MGVVGRESGQIQQFQGRVGGLLGLVQSGEEIESRIGHLDDGVVFLTDRARVRAMSADRGKTGGLARVGWAEDRAFHG